MNSQYIFAVSVSTNKLFKFENKAPYNITDEYTFNVENVAQQFLYKDEPYVLGFISDPLSGNNLMVLEKAIKK